MNFKRKRVTNKETGVHFRLIELNILNNSKDVKEEDRGIALYSDIDNTLYFAMELKEFEDKFVDGWVDIENQESNNIISLHFTLKDQSLAKIKSIIKKSKIDFSKCQINHCFLSKEVVKEKGFDTDLVEYLDNLSDRVICHSGKGLDIHKSRVDMLSSLYKRKGRAIFVGEIKEGVSEELEIAEYLGNRIVKLN